MATRRPKGISGTTRTSAVFAPATSPADPGALARSIGERIKRARVAAGLTQQQLAAPRYSKAYISALEHGQSRPSMAALTFLAERLGLPATHFLEDAPAGWTRLEADLALAASRWQEAVDAYEALLAGETGQARRAELLLGLAEARAGLDQAAPTIAAAAEASRIFSELGRPAEAALADYWLSAGVYEQGNTREASAILESTLAKVRAGLRVEPDFQARLLMALAANGSRTGDHQVALSYLEELRSLNEALDDRRRGVYFYGLAHSYRATGDFEAAIRAGLTGLGLLRAAGLELEWAGLLNGLARSYLALGNVAKAAEAISEARTTFERLGDRRWLSYVNEADAEVHLAAGDLSEGARLGTLALELAEIEHDETGIIDALLVLARLSRAHAAKADALASYARAAELVERSGHPARIREVLGEYADLLAEAGEQGRAYELMRRALRAG